MRVSSLQRLQSRYGAAIDREINSHLVRPGATAGFFGMMSYQLGYVDDRFEPAHSKAGKRFRPLLCLIATEAVGGKAERALRTAASIELLHNFSLIHDDIEDHDPSRRHRATVWKVWGESQAINTGDGMLALAGRLILDSSPDASVTLDISRHFQQMCLTLTEGQYLDMSFEGRDNVRSAEYMDMIERKTGALIAFSLWSGAYLGGAGEETRDALRVFGLELGKAFQIQDDIMGMWGSKEMTGKEAATDLYNRKKTLPLLAALERAGPEEIESLQKFFRCASDDAGAVFSILDATAARSLCEARRTAHLKSAMEALGRTAIDGGAREELEALAHELTGQ